MSGIRITTYKPILIVQSSPMDTCSTVLVNVLYGLFHDLANQPIIGVWDTTRKCNFVNKINVIKTHVLDLDYFVNTYDNQYDLYFICSERKEKNRLIDEKYRSLPNIVLFDYTDLCETDSNPVENIVHTVYTRIVNKLPIDMQMSTLNAKMRLKNMNTYYETIKHRNFSYINPFYQIHGSHRNR